MEEPEHPPMEMRSLALTPTWSVATVLTILVVVSLAVERSIHRFSNWLRKTNRKPLLAAVEKMKEELMLLGFISLLLTATSSLIANICIPTKFYDGTFAPCTMSEIDEEREDSSREGRKLLSLSVSSHTLRRMLNGMDRNPCPKGHEPFVSFKGLEQLHRFIFVMAITHISYSCLTMLLAIVKIHSWRDWEDEARMDRQDSLTEITREETLRRHMTFFRHHASISLLKNKFVIWVTCFFRQFGTSVVRTDYLTLRKGFILNHNLPLQFDFHSYMVRSMEDEFSMIVGLSGKLWGFVVVFMLFNINGSNLYFWIAITPITLVLLLGTKLQNIIATLSLGLGLFQMGTNYKATLISQRLRETIHGWGKAAKRKRRHGMYPDDSTIHTNTSMVMSLEEDDDNPMLDILEAHDDAITETELQQASAIKNPAPPFANEASSRAWTPLLRPSATISPTTSRFYADGFSRSTSMPARRDRAV